MSRANQIKIEQEEHVESLTVDQLLDDVRQRVMPILTHKRDAAPMRVPADYANDDDLYVSIRLSELKKRLADIKRLQTE